MRTYTYNTYVVHTHTQNNEKGQKYVKKNVYFLFLSFADVRCHFSSHQVWAFGEIFGKNTKKNDETHNPFTSNDTSGKIFK